MKKILYVLPMLALAFAASAAFASYPMPPMPHQDNDIKVVNSNYAEINNNVGAISNTGVNRINSFGKIAIGINVTGAAVAGNTVQSQANDSYTEIYAPCTMCRTGDIVVINKNGVNVNNNVGAIANTGGNKVNTAGFFISGGLQKTGGATSGSVVTTLVNTSVTKISK